MSVFLQKIIEWSVKHTFEQKGGELTLNVCSAPISADRYVVCPVFNETILQYFSIESTTLFFLQVGEFRLHSISWSGVNHNAFSSVSSTLSIIAHQQ